ncbi:LPS O-antigen chain length determinant protein WzzB [Thiomicrorhabdus arctica]|uniref:LPS O-antigen chain length determinant protein WzzB n=1 Tax=Thiomicrorhabdus arctica TaxID=131540 RepID=UPI00037DC6F2|nr:Wzz/FepE/Etk N-terminal domain-containing protein [Thiomicrorhabdus arctica]
MDSRLKAQPVDNINNDEIDLFELWDGLVAEKLTILVSFVITVLLAAIYAFNVTPVYQSESYLLPPAAEKVLPMNELAIVLGSTATATATVAGVTATTGDAVNTPHTVFTQFLTNLGSRQTLKLIFNKYALVNTYYSGIDQQLGTEKIKIEKKAFNQFIEDFSIKMPTGKSVSKAISVSLALPLTEQEVADILNDLVKIAELKTIQQFYQQILSKKQSRIGLLNDRISSVRQIASDKRLDRMAQLDEAIIITQKLGLNKPVSAGPTLNINNVNTETVHNSALYLLGSDLLVAERTVLELRKNDDAFIPELRNLQELLQKLQSLKIIKTDFGVVTIDQAAVYGDKIKPKKSIILAVAGVLGLMLGVFIALIRRAIKKHYQASLPVA